MANQIKKGNEETHHGAVEGACGRQIRIVLDEAAQ
jgi:hypothetical protein